MMSDNARQVLIHLIWGIVSLVSMTILLIGATMESLSEHPFILRVEADSNVVKISENMALGMKTQSENILEQEDNNIILQLPDRDIPARLGPDVSIINISKDVRISCRSAGVCSQNPKFEGCEKQGDGVNWCCKNTGTCTLLGTYSTLTKSEEDPIR